MAAGLGPRVPRNPAEAHGRCAEAPAPGRKLSVHEVFMTWTYSGIYGWPKLP